MHMMPSDVSVLKTNTHTAEAGGESKPSLLTLTFKFYLVHSGIIFIIIIFNVTQTHRNSGGQNIV